MQPFDREPNDATSPLSSPSTLIVGRVNELSPGNCVRVQLPEGGELAVYNVDGEYYATDNFCPHKGAPLAEGILCGHIVECGWHGWQFDVRTGQCLTVTERIKTFEVRVEDGWVVVRIA